MVQTIGGYDNNQEVSQTALERVTVTSKGTKTAMDVIDASQLVPERYDAIKLEPQGSSSPTSVKYYLGGLAGTLVATLTIVYDSGEIYTVVRS